MSFTILLFFSLNDQFFTNDALDFPQRFSRNHDDKIIGENQNWSQEPERDDGQWADHDDGEAVGEIYHNLTVTRGGRGGGTHDEKHKDGSEEHEGPNVNGNYEMEKLGIIVTFHPGQPGSCLFF